MSKDSQSKPRLAIIMPCYNLGAYIDSAIKSVLDQSYKDYSVYIIDDGSTDESTIKRLKELSKSLPDNFIIDMQKKNRGMNRAVNYATKKISSDYIFIFSPDDELKSTYLEETVSHLDKNPSTAAVCTWLEYFEGDTGVRKYTQEGCTLPSMLLENGFSGASVIRKSVWDKLGGYDPHPSQRLHEDYNLWLGLLSEGYDLNVIEKPLFRYRIRANSLSHDLNVESEIAWMKRITSKYSSLYSKYAYIVIPHLWEQNILKYDEYKDSIKGHDWLDQEYKKQLQTIKKLSEDNKILSSKLLQIESSNTYRAVNRLKTLLSPFMRNKS